MFIQLIKFTKRKHTQIPTKLLDQQHNFYDMLYLKTFEIYPHFVTRGECNPCFLFRVSHYCEGLSC